ncbi:MmoB/DmpM family protein [Zhongshania marina]|uniref:Monooxygenase n=1 Tax=Zhongshania marina TaxID=2304603 RepID=A0A2S4HKG8_9GAMM|nr:MmoB/DmpM family protein [Marortus luteolus]POP54488.1 monooxygenase [Marortus luteolus]
MNESKHPVFIAFQANNDTLPIVNAITRDNPLAIVNEMPAMVKIDCPGRLVIKRSSIEEEVGREFDLQELQINLISLSGEINEDDDEFTLSWN